MSNAAQLHIRDTPSKRLALSCDQPLTIGSANTNGLVLENRSGVSPYHAVVRFTTNNGWVVCDWQSSDGTYLEGERIRRCRALSDGDEIFLGQKGPVLVFSLTGESAKPASNPAAQNATSRQSRLLRTIDINGKAVPLGQIRSASILSEPHYPHIFSWWLLTSVFGLLLLPFPVLFWPLELAALACWILLGSRKSHTLVVVQHDGQAQHRAFANRMTALAYRNGIRKAISKSQNNS